MHTNIPSYQQVGVMMMPMETTVCHGDKYERVLGKDKPFFGH